MKSLQTDESASKFSKVKRRKRNEKERTCTGGVSACGGEPEWLQPFSPVTQRPGVVWVGSAGSGRAAIGSRLKL